jgi:hypothetical protein
LTQHDYHQQQQHIQQEYYQQQQQQPLLQPRRVWHRPSLQELTATGRMGRAGQLPPAAALAASSTPVTTVQAAPSAAAGSAVSAAPALHSIQPGQLQPLLSLQQQLREGAQTMQPVLAGVRSLAARLPPDQSSALRSVIDVMPDVPLSLPQQGIGPGQQQQQQQQQPSLPPAAALTASSTPVTTVQAAPSAAAGSAVSATQPSQLLLSLQQQLLQEQLLQERAQTQPLLAGVRSLAAMLPPDQSSALCSVIDVVPDIVLRAAAGSNSRGVIVATDMARATSRADRIKGTKPGNRSTSDRDR